MLTLQEMEAIEKDAAANRASSLQADDIRQLVAWLEEKDDNLRYKSFLILQARSQAVDDVYAWWDTFVGKFGSANSYQRSLGLMLVAENVRWDAPGKFETILEPYLAFCDDEKPITVRQCIQSLGKIVPYKKGTHDRIVEKLTSIDLAQRKETQRKILLLDILTVLGLIYPITPDERIAAYFQSALQGPLLDARSRKAAAALLHS